MNSREVGPRVILGAVMRVFLSSRVSTQKHQRLNDRIAALCNSVGLIAFVPQHDIPETATCIQILEHNEQAVDDSELVITVFDTAGAGVALELGRARAKRKVLVGYRSAHSQTREKLGMMLEGAWSDLPGEMRAASLAELRGVLTNLMQLRNR